MKDYKSIWIKWLVFFEAEPDLRKQLLDSLHDEVKKGFDVITRISTEELEHHLDAQIFGRIKTLFEMLVSYSVFGGYMLNLIYSGIDPKEKKLFSFKETSLLGSTWMEHYQKDQGKSLLLGIDPLISLFLDGAKQSRMNQLLLSYPDLQTVPHKQIGVIDNFLSWSSHQGYILALLEQKLINKEKIDKNL